MLRAIRRFFRNLGPWGSFSKRDTYMPILGVDYEVPPEIIAEHEARRRGRAIIDVGDDPEGGAVFIYEGAPIPPGTILHAERALKIPAAVH